MLPLVARCLVQEDPKLLMWYDQALTRTGADRGYAAGRIAQPFAS